MLTCPVCSARFRGAHICPRCGADLSAIMTLAQASWRLRRSARDALAQNDFERARHYALAAQNLHDTEPGRRLAWIAKWIAATKENGAIFTAPVSFRSFLAVCDEGFISRIR
jgi:hypothetical protein